MTDPTDTAPNRPRRPNPVLTIFVMPALWDSESVKAWREAGHKVECISLLNIEDPTRRPTSAGDLIDADLVIGPNCHFFTAALDKHGDEVLKWARKRRKESKQR